MSISALTDADRAKLKTVVKEGVNIHQQVADLKEGLRETVKAVAEELQIEARDINKAIAAVFKGSFDDARESVDVVEEILVITGNR